MCRINYLKLFLFSFISIFFFLGKVSFTQAAASLSLSPTSGSIAAGGTLSIGVMLDTGGAATTGVDAVITFNPQVLQVATTNPVVPGSLFRDQPAPTIDNTTGKLILHYGVTSTAYAYTSQPGTPGLLATINFTGRTAGTSAVTFTCSPSTTQGDTNVWSSGSDIVNCSANTGGSYTVTTGQEAEPTTTPATEEETTTPTPSELLESGITEWTFLLFALGIFFVLGGVHFLLEKRT